MTLVLLAGAWLTLGVIFCLVSGRGKGAAPAPVPESHDTPAARPAPREFVSFAVHEWAAAATTVATDELLSTRPGAIRRVAAK